MHANALFRDKNIFVYCLLSFGCQVGSFNDDTTPIYFGVCSLYYFRFYFFVVLFRCFVSLF